MDIYGIIILLLITIIIMFIYQIILVNEKNKKLKETIDSKEWFYTASQKNKNLTNSFNASKINVSGNYAYTNLNINTRIDIDTNIIVTTSNIEIDIPERDYILLSIKRQ